MSHFTVLVIGPNVEEQLQPYHEYECTGIKDEYVVFVPAKESPEELQKQYEEHKDDYESLEGFIKDYHGYEKNDEGVWGRITNPNAKWDWWVVGGRWSGFLKPKVGVVFEQGQSGVMGSHYDKEGADIILKGDVDWNGMRNRVRKNALKRYNLVFSAIKGLPEPEKWEVIRDNSSDIEEARKTYHNQPMVKAFGEVCKENHDIFGFFADVEDYLCTEDEYLEREMNSSVTTYAVVKDGVWYQKGEMGWWGMSSNEMSQDEWNKKYWELISSLPDETMLTLVDCHI